MTEAWFYVTSETGTDGRHQLLMRLLERALRSPRQLYLHCPDADSARQLSDSLWHGTRFLPHGLQEADAGQQVVLGHGPDPRDCHDILVNLCDRVPDYFSRFQRVVELVTGDPDGRRLSREKWTFYKHRGYSVARHELG